MMDDKISRDGNRLLNDLAESRKREEIAQKVIAEKDARIADLGKEIKNLNLKINQLKTELQVRKAYDAPIRIVRDKDDLVDWNKMDEALPVADGYICHLEDKTVELCYEFTHDGDFNRVTGITPVWWKK